MAHYDIKAPKKENGVSVRRGPAQRSYKDTLHKATPEDYAKLVHTLIAAILDAEVPVVSIYISYSRLCKFPKGFPKGVQVAKTENENIWKIKVSRLLQWLYDNGHTNISPGILGTVRREMGKDMGKLEINVDKYVSTEHNYLDAIEEEKQDEF